jgi:hypothetical protein
MRSRGWACADDPDRGIAQAGAVDAGETAGANAIVAAAPGRDDRRDSDVADPIVSAGYLWMIKGVVSGAAMGWVVHA